MDLETAGAVKIFANAFPANVMNIILFTNLVADLRESSRADIVPLAEALRNDERISRRYPAPKLAFGGSCRRKISALSTLRS